jgi:ribonuclease HI
MPWPLQLQSEGASNLMSDVIILTDRDEIEDLIGDQISDEQWLTIKEKIARNKHIWQVIDEALNDIISE